MKPLLNMAPWLAELPEPTRSELLTSLAQSFQRGKVCQFLTAGEIGAALRATGQVNRVNSNLVTNLLDDWSIIALRPAGDCSIAFPTMNATVRQRVQLGLSDAAEAGAVFRPLTDRELSDALRKIKGLPNWARSKLVSVLAGMEIVAVVPRDWRDWRKGLRRPSAPADHLSSDRRQGGCADLYVSVDTLSATRETREATTANACDARSATALETAPAGAGCHGSQP